MRIANGWAWIVVLVLSWWSVPVGAQEVSAPQPTFVPAAPLGPTAEPSPEPEVERRTNWALIAPGIGLLAGGYVLNLVVGLFGGAQVCIWSCSSPSSDWSSFRIWSLVPLAGPWAQLAAFPEALSENPGWIAWLLGMGALETTGLVLLVVGLASPREVMAQGARQARRPALEVAPGLGGLSIRGTF